MTQKASSTDKIKILSLEAKVRELKGKDIDLKYTYHDLDAVGGVIEKPAQISSSEIEFLRLKLERVNEDLN